MIGRTLCVTLLATWAMAFGVAGHPAAQTIYLAGQNVQPVFEGWEKNPDGTFTMIFGYLNRNYEEEPHIPVGPNNNFSPGPADRGQPTYFYPRRQSFQFRVTVPADWGDQKLTWTMTHNGKPQTAVGKLMPVWEVDEGVWIATRLGGVSGTTPGGNPPPTVKVVGKDTLTATVGEPLTLSVIASDEGTPGPPKARTANPAAPPRPFGGTDEGPVTTTGLPARTIGRNNPYLPRDRVHFVDARPTGLAVTWMHWRGPGAVTLEPVVVPIKGTKESLSGTAKTTVRFSEPGTYVIRAYADESIQTRYTDVTVTVQAAAGTR